MDWDRFEGIITARLADERTSHSGHIFASVAGAVDLQEILRETATTADEIDEIGLTPEEAMEPATGLIARHYQVESILCFEWSGFGPTSSSASIGSLRLSRDCEVAFFWQDSLWPSEVAFARLQPAESPDVWNGLTLNLLQDNGGGHGIGMFGSLPSSTINRRPDLVSTRTLKEGYWRWLEHFDGGTGRVWDVLRRQLIGQLEQPDTQVRSLQSLQRLAELTSPGYLREVTNHSEPMCEADRRIVLNNYFAACYQEYSHDINLGSAV